MIQFYNNRFKKIDFIKDLKVVKCFGDKASDIVIYRIGRLALDGKAQ